MFSVIYDGKHGKTVASDNPKLEAYKYVAMVTRDGRGYQLTFQADGAVTAAVDGLVTLTYENQNVRVYECELCHEKFSTAQQLSDHNYTGR